jgi:hypothetical protein
MAIQRTGRKRFELDWGGAGLLLALSAVCLSRVVGALLDHDLSSWGASLAGGIAALASTTLVYEVGRAALRAITPRSAEETR